MVTGAGNLQPQIGALDPGQRQSLDSECYSFITLQPSNIQETGHARAPPRGARCESLAVDSRMDDSDSFPANPSRDEVVSGALTDRMKFRPSIRPRQWTLGSPHRCGNGPGSLGERSGAKEVRDDGAERQSGARSEKQGKLVDVFDHNVGPARRDGAVHCSTAE
jgi:hypothetical protein